MCRSKGFRDLCGGFFKAFDFYSMANKFWNPLMRKMSAVPS